MKTFPAVIKQQYRADVVDWLFSALARGPVTLEWVKSRTKLDLVSLRKLAKARSDDAGLLECIEDGTIDLTRNGRRVRAWKATPHIRLMMHFVAENKKAAALGRALAKKHKTAGIQKEG